MHRELVDLAASGLVTVTRSSNQKYYQANSGSPIFQELHGLVVKTVGLTAPLARALAPLEEEISAAFVYGSIAKGTERASSDIDLMIISDTLHHADLYRVLMPVEAQLGRHINPVLMTPMEWRNKRTHNDSFASRVSEQPRTFIVGAPSDIS